MGKARPKQHHNFCNLKTIRFLYPRYLPEKIELSLKTCKKKVCLF